MAAGWTCVVFRAAPLSGDPTTLAAAHSVGMSNQPKLGATVRDITGAPTAAVLCEYVILWEKLEHVVLRPSESDRFVWKWTADGTYSAHSAYRSFFIGMKSLIGTKHLWCSCVPPKVKLFFWLSLLGRLWTADRRKRHGLQQDAACALCSQEDETTDHLLLSCEFTREIWHMLLMSVGLQGLAPQGHVVLVDWWQRSRKLLPKSARRGFDSAAKRYNGR